MMKEEAKSYGIVKEIKDKCVGGTEIEEGFLSI